MFSRSKAEFVTRLRINNKNLEQVSAVKFLGVWLTENLSWQKNYEQICTKAHMRLSLLTKLKYVGVSRTDLLDIYKLFIRSILEYASVVFHSRLTEEQSKMLDSIEKLCLKIILADQYEDYEGALKICSMSSLRDRRELRVEKFIKKALKHKKHKHMFPVSDKFLKMHTTLENHKNYSDEVPGYTPFFDR